MRLDAKNFRASTFESAEKDLFGIVQRLIENNKLKNLLFYQTKDAIRQKNLTDEETLSLLHSNIRVIPNLSVDPEVKAYVIISFDNFVPNATNPEYRDNIITFDIICHMDCWVLENYQLRPYKIAGEIDGMLNNSKLNGIGTVEFAGGNQLILNSELAGFSLMYRVVNDV